MITQDEVVRRSQAFESFKLEAEKCLAQSEKFKNEREEFESAVYGKVCVLKMIVLGLANPNEKLLVVVMIFFLMNI